VSSEASAMPSKKEPSQSERALFRSTVGEVRRLHDDRVAHAPKGRRKARRPAPDAPPTVDMMPDGVFDNLPAAGERQLFSRGGLQQRFLRRLAKGQLTIQANLDLHGMSVAQARRALSHFLQECALSDIRRVRIVHGKGFGSRDARPVLKAQVDRWLRLRPDVLAFCSAARHDGGTGAVYVVLRHQNRA